VCQSKQVTRIDDTTYTDLANLNLIQTVQITKADSILLSLLNCQTNGL